MIVRSISLGNSAWRQYLLMQEDAKMSSLSFSPQLMELKQKLIQPTVLGFSQEQLTRIDTDKLKLPKKKSNMPSPQQDPKAIQKLILRSIQPKDQDEEERTKAEQKSVNGIITRQRYILPPVKDVRKLLKKNSAIENKNQQIANNYMNKEISRHISPLKKQSQKTYSSTKHMVQQLQHFLKKGKTRSKNYIYYRPEQVKRNPLPYENINRSQDQTRHFKSDIKLQVAKVMRKRTKTQLKQEYPEQFDFFELKTCFSMTDYVTFESISNPSQPSSSRLAVSQKIFYVPKQDDLKEFLQKYETTNEQIQINSLLKSNFCSVQFGKYEVYVGQMVGKVRSGKGILFTHDAYFQGLWKCNNKIKGVEITKEGVYKGCFYNNRREGKGQFQWTNGEMYVGDWLKGSQHGQGLWINTRGQSYNGEWRCGKAEGIGSLIIKSTHNSKTGRKYKGAFLANRQHGFGRENFVNGGSYEGMYKDDCPNGKGTYTWANGSVYQGQFYGGMRQGMGVLKTSFNLTYKGEFRDDYPDGQCEIILPNGDTYYGMVKDGKKNGKGTLKVRKSKEIFNGYWRNDYFVAHQDQM